MRTNLKRTLAGIAIGLCTALTGLFATGPLAIILCVMAIASLAFMSGWLIGWDRAAETYTGFRAELETARCEAKVLQEDMDQFRRDFCANLEKQQ